MMFKIVNGMAPSYMEDLFKQETGLNVYNLRASHKNIALPKTRTGETITEKVLPLLELNYGMLSQTV